MGWLLTILRGAWEILRALTGQQPTAASEATAAATATTELKQEQAANAIETQASAARAAADVAVVHELAEAGPIVDAAANQRIRDADPGHFRD